MVTDKSKYPILILGFIIAVLLIITSCCGIFIAGFYRAETPNWQSQSIAQDMINLSLITPLLIISSVYAAAGSRFALQAWFGIIIYLIYTFIIYCFSVHFNSLFFLYCLILGLSFYAGVFSLASLFRKPVNLPEKHLSFKIAGILFIIISLLFYIAWLSEVIPASLSGKAPQSLKTAGLPTNPVHVLDLSIVLPGIIICGISVLKKNSKAILFTPVVATFLVLMTVTILFLLFYAY